MILQLAVFRPSARGVGLLILVCAVLFPIALMLLLDDRPRHRGPTWGELLGPFRRLWPRPVVRRTGHVHALLITDSHDVVLVKHDRRHQAPYYTLPGGPVLLRDASPREALTRSIGHVTLGDLENWSLIDVEDHGDHREFVYAGRLPELDLANAGHAWQLTPLTPQGIAHLDLHPHPVAHLIRRMAEEGSDPLSLPDLREEDVFRRSDRLRR